jgi:hypothetical protein
MFRLTIRELFWMTACVALGIGWWRASHTRYEVTIEAESLPDVSPIQIICSVSEANLLPDLQRKPVAEGCVLSTPRIRIVEEEEEKLGIDFEE